MNMIKSILRKTGYEEVDELKPILMHPDSLYFSNIPLLNSPFEIVDFGDFNFVIHYTAGSYKQNPESFLKNFVKRGLCTYFIDRDGRLYQQHDGFRCGYSVGNSIHPITKDKIKKKCIAVEIACPGKLEMKKGKLRTWFNKIIPLNDARYISDIEIEKGYLEKGWWAKYKDSQEKTLSELIAWHIALGVKKENIFGHDAIRMPLGKKKDPGGSLSMPVSEFVKEKCLDKVDKYRIK